MMMTRRSLKGLYQQHPLDEKPGVWMEDKNSKAAFAVGNIFKELGQAEVGCRAREAGSLRTCSVHLLTPYG